MNQLISGDGRINYGIYADPINVINYTDYQLTTPMGMVIPWPLTHLKFNQFIFTGIIGPEFIIGLAVVDLKTIANGFVYVLERSTGKLFETNSILPSWPFAGITPDPSAPNARFSSGKLAIRIKDNHIRVKSKAISLATDLNFSNTAPLRICTRAGYRGWVYTEKTSPVPMSGQLILKDKAYDIASPDYMALMDWSAGYMRKNTYWNWASTACTLPDKRAFGLNLASGVNETGFTENAFWVNNVMTKVDTVNFIFNDANLMRTWHIISADSKINLKFTPEAVREEKKNAWFMASKFSQLIGKFNGTVTTDAGETILLTNCPGWTEDHYAKW